MRDGTWCLCEDAGGGCHGPGVCRSGDGDATIGIADTDERAIVNDKRAAAGVGGGPSTHGIDGRGAATGAASPRPIGAV